MFGRCFSFFTDGVLSGGARGLGGGDGTPETLTQEYTFYLFDLTVESTGGG